MKRFVLYFSKCFIIYILFVIFVLFMLYTSPVVSASSSDTAVLEDLTRDPNFNENDYLSVSDDYSLQVIQIAETSNNELIIYVYQPCNSTLDLLGSKISMSYGYSTNGKNLDPFTYSLELLSTYGVFDKYLVKNFNVPNETHRYYNIISIFREYNSSIDGENEDYMELTDKAYSVGQQWHCYSVNNTISYEKVTFETFEIDTKFIGNFEFNHGLSWGNFLNSFSYGDCWFIAFNCDDYIINHIYDADLTYSGKKMRESWTLGVGSEFFELGDFTNKITLTDIDEMTYRGDGLFARTYNWNRILKSSDFIDNVKKDKATFEDGVEDIVKESQWVFTFVETEKKFNSYDYSYISEYTDISDVGILRLHFQDISGKCYDLGVVNSLYDPDNIPDGYGSLLLSDIGDWFEKLFAIIGLIILILVLIFCSSIFGPVLTIFGFVLKALLFFISIPIRLIKWVFKR